MGERRQAGQTNDWWSITCIHESAHGMVAFALDCQPVELELNRRKRVGDPTAGFCRAPYEKTWYGDIANIYVANAPFCAHQFEILPCGDKDDLHERQNAFQKFSKLIKSVDEALFRKCVDDPLIDFFADTDIQAAVLALASQLYANNRVSLKQVNHWREKLAIPHSPCEALAGCCLKVAEAIADQ